MVIFYTNQCWNHDIQTALVQTKVILLFDLTRRLAMEFLRGLSLMRRCRFARKSVPWMEKKKKTDGNQASGSLRSLPNHLIRLEAQNVNLCWEKNPAH